MKTQTQPLATAIKTSAPLFEVKRPVEAILRDLTINPETGAVTINKGQQLTADEIGIVVLDSHAKGQVAGIMRANLVRLSRALPPIKGNYVDMDDRKVFIPAADGKAEKAAADYVKDNLRRAMGDGSFYNMLQVADAIDTIEVNKLGDVSPYSVKDAIPMLRSLGAMPAAKAKIEGPDRFKITASKALPLVNALKDKASQSTIEEVGAKIVERRARTAKKGKKDGTDTTPKPEHTPATVNAALVSVRGQWELAVKGGAKIDDMRKTCREEIIALARLGGFDVVELKK